MAFQSALRAARSRLRGDFASNYQQLSKPAFRQLCDTSTQKVSGESQSSPFRKLLNWYNGKLRSAPIPTKMVTSCILFAAGDVIAQVYVIRLKKKPYSSFDIPRMLRAATFGFIILGPLGHLHFNFLQYLVVEKLAVRQALVPFVKMGIEQFVYWAPGMAVIYHFSIGIMEGLGVSAAVGRVKQRFIPTLKANYILWPAAGLINFKLVPVAHQLNFILFVSLFWAVYLSHLGATHGGHGH